MAAILEAAKNTLASTRNVNVTSSFLDYPIVQYEEVTATNGMHNIPRFGHTNNFSVLFLEDDLEGAAARDDYTAGLLFVGSFLFTFFALWCIMVLAFKVCCCKYHFLGFLSGRPFTLDDDEEPTKDEYNKWKNRANRIRIVFLVSGLLLITSSGLMISHGFGQLEETQLIADKSLDDARVLVNDASVLAEDLGDVGLSAIDLRDKLVVELQKERLCPNDPNYLAQDEITRAIQENSGQAIDMLELLGEFATKDLKRMEQGLSAANNVIDGIDGLVENLEEREWVGVGFVVPLVILTTLMMIGTVMSYKSKQNECYEFTISWILLPMFIFWIVASFILCGLLALTASINADFCTGGADMTPDSTILQSLVNAGMDQSSTEFQVARYYLHQCTRESEVDPFLFLRTYQAEVMNAQSIVHELSTSLEKIDIVDLSFNCGRDFEPLSSSLDTMMAILDRLDEAGTSGLKLLSCERIVPLYANVVYDGTCKHSVMGLTWIFASLLVIATTGMLMITFRSAYVNNVVVFDVDEVSVTKAMKRGQDVAKASSSQSRPEANNWREQTARQDTSDSGSIYTDGDELRGYEAERNGSFDPIQSPKLYELEEYCYGARGNESKKAPKLYELEENSYDSQGNVQASAPFEHELLDYDYDGYNSNTNHKSRVY